MKTYHEVLAEGKGETVRFHLKEAGAQNHEPTNRNSIQGQVRGRVCTTKQSPDLTGYGKCCGCEAQEVQVPGIRQEGVFCPAVAKVHVLIRGDLPDMRLWRAAPQVATSGVIGKESAEAIVASKERRAEHELGEALDELL